MHIYVAGIGGAGMGPLAEMAHKLGYDISGSDLVESESLNKIRKLDKSIVINIGQHKNQIKKLHQNKPIDWYIYSSALSWANPPNEELNWAKSQPEIKTSKRDQFLNHLISQNHLKLLAVSGSHGKTTTTALLIDAFIKLDKHVSYALGGKLINQPAAQLNKLSQWFIYEADEFDNNFLTFHPQISVIAGLDHDHFEVFPTLQSYYQAYIKFINQSKITFLNKKDYLKIFTKLENNNLKIINSNEPNKHLKLLGKVNRQNAQLALEVLKHLKPEIEENKLIDILNSFQGCLRRFEKVAHNIFSDYAHNPIKIQGCLQIASELNKPIVAIYEPHSHRRQIHVQNQYKDIFKGVKKLYWLPSHPAREDDNLKPLTPEELINTLSNPQIAEVAYMNDDLKQKIKLHQKEGSIIVGMSASGLDTWLKNNF